MPLHRRLPKRGFTNIFAQPYTIINLRDLNRFDASAEVDMEMLRKAGLVKGRRSCVKLLGQGEIANPVVVKVHKVSSTAREKIEAAGGRILIL
jgi:large subunit ribosomal protein L15